MFRILLLALLALNLTACEDDDVAGNGDGSGSSCYDGACVTRELPFSDGDGAPTLVDVALECQSGSIVVLATITDPQGDPDLLTIVQTIGVYTDEDCEDPQIVLEDDLAGSGVEESFGDAVLKADNPALYAQVCGCDTWPVRVSLVDANGNKTLGRAVARVIR